MGTSQSKIENRKPNAGWPTAAPFRGSPPSLAAVLEAEFTGAQLRDLAKWLGITPKGNSRLGLLDQVVVALTARTAKIQESPGALLEGLSADQQDFARRLLTARDHELPVPRNVAAMVWARQLERDGDRRLADMIDSLRRRALLFPTHATFPGAFRDVYYQWLPLQGTVPVVEWDVKPIAAALLSRRAPISGNFLEDFESFLSAVMQTGVTLRAPMPAHKQAPRLPWLREWEHDLEDAERVLRSRPNWVPDPNTGIGVPLLSPFTPQAATMLENQTGLAAAHCEFLFAIACTLQMIEAPDPDSGQAPLPRHVRVRGSAIEEWLVMTGDQKMRAAWRAWTEELFVAIEARSAAALRTENSFRLMRAIGARDLTPALFAAEWCALRRYVTRVFRGVPDGAWIGWRELARQLHDFYPECAWTFATRSDWWFALASSGARLNLSRADEWRASVGAVIEQIVRGPLAWLGAVEAQVDEDGALEAFRTTDLGAALFGRRDGALPAGSVPATRAVEPITWVDKHILRIPPAPDRAAFIALVRRAAERDQAPFAYAFTPASIERALNEGLSFEDLAAQFRRAKVTLPRAIGEQFRQIARRHGRIRVYQSLTILELSDDFAARELAAASSLLKHVVYQISPRAFVLPDEAVDALIEELQAKGYMPRVK
jgi:hypothetical protein